MDINPKEFRIACMKEDITQEVIAKKYGVDVTYIGKAIRKKINSPKAVQVRDFAMQLIRKAA